MRYGTQVTVTENGLRLDNRDLESVGMFDRSKCWGVWLTNWLDKPAAQHPVEHLLLSPLHPSSWPALFRLELKLNNAINSPRAAAQVLADNHFNILLYDLSPSGYHHSTWTLIGECDDQNILSLVRQYRGQVAPGERTLGHQPLWDWSNQVFAPTMLRYASSLMAKVLAANVSERFLNPHFVEQSEAFGGRLYDWSRLTCDDNTRELGRAQQFSAVSCKWLQSLAFFWLYANNIDDPVCMAYDAQSSALTEVTSSAAYPMRDKMHRWFEDAIPRKALAYLDTRDKFMRVAFCEKPHEEKDVLIDVPYRAVFASPLSNTRGLVKRLTCLAAERGVDIKHMTNSITDRQPSSENNTIRLLARVSSNFVAEHFSLVLASQLPESVDGADLEMDPNSIHISNVGAHNLFVSTRIDWPGFGRLQKLLRIVASCQGFNCVYGDRTNKPLLSGARKRRGGFVLQEDVRDLIADSHAFIQVLPAFNMDNLQWMEWEFGVACGSNRPYAFLIEKKSAGSFYGWLKKYKVAVGQQVFEFDGSSGDEILTESIKRAVSALSLDLR